MMSIDDVQNNVSGPWRAFRHRVHLSTLRIPSNDEQVMDPTLLHQERHLLNHAEGEAGSNSYASARLEVVVVQIRHPCPFHIDKPLAKELSQPFIALQLGGLQALPYGALGHTLCDRAAIYHNRILLDRRTCSLTCRKTGIAIKQD
jgi:hypothetical protein